jgi:hypothetical protein
MDTRLVLAAKAVLEYNGMELRLGWLYCIGTCWRLHPGLMEL